MRPETLKVLKATREMLTEEKSWTKGAYGRNLAGADVTSNDPEAVCWCLQGAFNRQLRSIAHDEIWNEVSVEIRRLFDPVRSAMRFNDAKSTTHADVLAKLDSLIAEGVTEHEG